MSEFDDVYNKYINILNKYIRLRSLLVIKLKKQKIDIDFDSLNFKELIELIDTIATLEYDIFDNQEPSSNEYNTISALKYINENNINIVESNLANFNEQLAKRTIYYMKLLRYYLAKKGVNLQKINNAKTLEDHILLIDFIPRIKNTYLTVVLNNNEETPVLYYGQNFFHISVVDEDGNPVTTGQILFKRDKLNIKQELSDIIEVEINHLDIHWYKFQYIGGNSNYLDSNIVVFDDLYVEPMPIRFGASLVNTTDRIYKNQNDSLKGYINDVWILRAFAYNIHDNEISYPIIIDINDTNRQMLSNTFNYENITFSLHNNEHNNEPIEVLITPLEDPHYNFDTENVSFLVNILYPYYKFIVAPERTNSAPYTFEINFYDENTNEITNEFNGEEINLIIDNIAFNETAIINDNKATFLYENNLLPHSYEYNWVKSDINNYGTFKIKPNVDYPNDIIYLEDEPEIRILNSNIDGLIIAITKENDGSYDDNNIFFDFNHVNDMEYFPLIVDSNDCVDNMCLMLIPDKYKKVGTYHVRLENFITEEEFEFTYIIKNPYSYTYEIGDTIAIFYINIEYIDAFNKDNLTDYIKIYEYDKELEYQYTYYDDDNYIIVKADVDVNEDFKGFNTFSININNHLETVDFKLNDDNERIFEIVSDIELGNNEIDIACYDENVHQISVTIKHNNNVILNSYQINSENEDFIFNQYISEIGNYTFTIVGNNITEEYTIYVDKRKVKLQDFKFKDKIDSNDMESIDSYLGFGFSDGNSFADNIDVIFYCDTPQNILTTKTLDVTNIEYEIYDIFLGNIEKGEHTIYASFIGNDNYQSFLLSKTFYKLIDTYIIYDKEVTSIDEGDYIDLSLLVIDEDNNIVNKGYYIINNEIYDLNDDIILVPHNIDDYIVNIQYIGEDEYKNSTINMLYTINEGKYNYYASSLIGDNTNDGLSPYSPVKDINTLLQISTPDDKLCLMEGEYEHNILMRNAKLYGYNKHQIKSIKLNMDKIDVNIELMLSNVSLNTGNGYTNIVGHHIFKNNSNECVMLKTIPGEHEESYWNEDVYEILMDNEIIFNNGVNFVSGVIHKNGGPIGEKLVKVYHNGSIVRAAMSNDLGEFGFSFSTNEDTRLIIVTNRCNKTINIHVN